MPGYELILISMSRGYGWHCLVGDEYSTAGNPPRKAGEARREAVEHLRQVHGVEAPATEEQLRVATHNELVSRRVFG